MPLLYTLLGYWNTRGLAQPIRLFLNYVGEDFEDVRYQQGDAPDYSREKWLTAKEKLKDELDFPNLPYYIDDDVKITQSNAILKHVARKYKLDGTTVREKATVDMLLDQEMDLRNGMTRVAYNPEYEKIKGDYFEQVAPKMEAFEKYLADKSWFVGEQVTIADFHIYELLDQHRLMKEDILESFPQLRAFLDRFEALPTIAKYMSSDMFLRRPVNNTRATFK